MAAHIHVLIDKKQQFLALSTLSIVTKILIQQDNRTPNNSVAKETKYYVILPVYPFFIIVATMTSST